MENYKDYKIEPITRRWAHPYIVYLLAECFSTKEKDLKFFTGQIESFKSGFTVFNQAYTDKSWQRYLDFYGERLEDIEKTINHLIKKIKKIIDTGNLPEIQEYFNFIRTAIIITTFPRGIDIALMPLLREFLSEEDLAVVSTFDDVQVGKEEISLLELASSKISKEKKLIKLKDVYNEYKYIYYGLHNEQPPTFEFYSKSFLDIKNPQERLNQIKLQKIELSNKKKLLLDGLNPKQKNLVYIASKIAFIKDYNKYAMTLCIGLSWKYWNILSESTKTSMEDILMLFPEEIVELSKGKKFDFNKIKERNKNIIFIGLPDEFKVLTGKDAISFEEKYLASKMSFELKGRVASKGRARGNVRIVLGRDDFSKVKKGDILVVSNTTPDYVPIMKLASAIVAEEGGLTAHVSVVSREFGIPCIVGVQGVTETLHPGDLVEVDANKGIVKIIKRAKA